jgi:hypothetical protein
MQILVEVVRGQAPLSLTVEELRSAIVAGRVPHGAFASTDGGASWAEAREIAGLPAPSPAAAPIGSGETGGDVALRMVVPVGRSGWAILAGYLGLALMLTAVPGWGIAAYTGPKPAEALVGAAITIAVVVPVVGAGLLGHRAIANDPKKHGMGRVGFAYAMATLTVVLMVAALLHGALK